MTAEQTRAALRASTEAQARVKRENAAHTLGPWTKADRLNGPWWHISSDHTIGGNRCLSGKQAIACVHGESKKGSAAYAEMFEANARLIAAAPELLEALQSIVECCNEDQTARDYASRQTEIRGIARLAIAKATGDTP